MKLNQYCFAFALPFFSSITFLAAQVDTAWVRRYNGTGNDEDGAYAIAIDPSGYVYVTGYSCGLNTMEDYATIKYTPNGDTAWIRRYNGLGNMQDRARDIAVDNNGNVYITGESVNPDSFSDFVTIKYLPGGDTAWIRRYDGPSNGDDNAVSLAVDGPGNIYITGSSFNSSSNCDFVTIKYLPNGDTAWVRRYDGPGHFYDEAYALAVDRLDNAYVTGLSYGNAGSHVDIVTVKYLPGGDTAWVRRYNGPASGADFPSAIAADNTGTVYVTGFSTGFEDNTDYLTIKYTPVGEVKECRPVAYPADQSFGIYPNPARGYFTAVLPRPLEQHSIRIYDVSGKRIKEIACKVGELEKRISFSGFMPGVYFIEIDGTTVKKVVKIK